MKKLTIKNLLGKSLSANLYGENKKTILIISHGFGADKTHGGTIDIIVEPFLKDNIDVLAFDFSGSGESDKEYISTEREIDDLKSIIEYSKKRGYKNIFLLGYSLGGQIALRCYSEDINGIILIAPAVNSPKYPFEKKFGDQLNNNKDYLFKEGKRGPDTYIDKKIIKEFDNFKIEDFRGKIHCPVIVFHGTKDSAIPYGDSEKLIKVLPHGSKLILVEDVEHLIGGEKLAGIAEKGVEFLGKIREDLK